ARAGACAGDAGPAIAGGARQSARLGGSHAGPQFGLCADGETGDGAGRRPASMTAALNHVDRRVAILQSHPDVRHLFGANSWTALFALGLVIVQFALAWTIRNQPWWAAFLLAYGVGAFVIHGLNCVIHECTHNLVFRGAARNKAVAILATLPS